MSTRPVRLPLDAVRFNRLWRGKKAPDAAPQRAGYPQAAGTEAGSSLQVREALNRTTGFSTNPAPANRSGSLFREESRRRAGCLRETVPAGSVRLRYRPGSRRRSDCGRGRGGEGRSCRGRRRSAAGWRRIWCCGRGRGQQGAREKRDAGRAGGRESWRRG